jgi:hypothetical protein
LTEATTITQGNFNMNYNLSGTGRFIVQQGGNNAFAVYNSTGKVMIGRDATADLPNSQLDIVGGATGASTRLMTLRSDFIANNTGTSLALINSTSNSSDAGAMLTALTTNSSNGRSELLFNVHGGGGANGALIERMRIQGDGVVQVTNLAGTGNRMVAANASGQLYALSVPSANNEGVYYYASGNIQTFVVPAGVTQITVHMWGGGGGGSWYSLSWNYGSGGSGAYLTGTIGVTPGEILRITPGFGGAGGVSCSSYRGNGGQGSIISRGGTNLAVAPGGGGGSYGNAASVGRGGGVSPNGTPNGSNGNCSSTGNAAGGSFTTTGMATSTATNGNNGNTTNGDVSQMAPPGTASAFYVSGIGVGGAKSSSCPASNCYNGGNGLIVITY